MWRHLSRYKNTPNMLHLQARSVFAVRQNSMITYTHKLLDGPREQIPAMLRVKELVASVNFTGEGRTRPRGLSPLTSPPADGRRQEAGPGMEEFGVSGLVI